MKSITSFKRHRGAQIVKQPLWLFYVVCACFIVIKAYTSLYLAPIKNHTYLGQVGFAPSLSSSSYVRGYIDGLSKSGGDFYVNGWACQTGDSSSIKVHIYLGGAAGSGTFIGSWTANKTSSTGVANQCNSSGTNHRFQIKLEHDKLLAHSGKKIYIHGISTISSGHLTITRSGHFSMPTVGPKIEAEDFVNYYDTSTANEGGQYRDTSVGIQTTTDIGGGYNVGWMHTNEWLEYDILVPESGYYTLDARVAGWTTTAKIGVKIDGVSAVPSNSIFITGCTQCFTTQSLDLGYLQAGLQTLRVDVVNGPLNLNWIELLSAGKTRSVIYIHTDMLGSPVAETNESGAVVN